ncbi:MAG TPA: hypothetical protein VHF27_07905 [Acidimicrobiales bacterium]|nr:hypothetical protein [Acidimicrobiales bacterium]
MANKFIRGALIQFMDAFGLPVPNVIVFQLNPETMTHTWTQPEAPATPAGGPAGRVNPLAVRSLPGETFSFTLVMDSNESIADDEAVAGSLATVSGVYSRLAALEMLQYPVPSAGGGLLGSVSVSVGPGGVAGAVGGGAAAEASRPVPASQVPTVLFVWGPGRVVPVRVTALTVTETLYDALLNPTHAEATVTLRVLTPEELVFVTGPLATVAKGAYAYSHGLRQVLALANLGNATESIIGMLPI